MEYCFYFAGEFLWREKKMANTFVLSAQEFLPMPWRQGTCISLCDPSSTFLVGWVLMGPLFFHPNAPLLHGLGEGEEKIVSWCASSPSFVPIPWRAKQQFFQISRLIYSRWSDRKNDLFTSLASAIVYCAVQINSSSKVRNVSNCRLFLRP